MKAMNRVLASILTVLTIGAMLGSLSGVSAKEYNQRPHLDPGSQSKVNSVIASNRKKEVFDSSRFGRITNDGCGDLNIGTVSDSKRPPREIIIVAREIINVNRNC